MRAFLDANILFSASCPGSNTARFVTLLTAKGVAITSDYAAIEAQRNIAAKRPQWMSDFKAITSPIQLVPSTDGPVPVVICSKDRPILATAIREQCDYLVTGDHKHFGHLYGQNVGGTRVVTILMMRDALQPLLD